MERNGNEMARKIKVIEENSQLDATYKLCNVDIKITIVSVYLQKSTLLDS